MKVCTHEQAAYCCANAPCGYDNTAQGDRAMRNHASPHIFARNSMHKGPRAVWQVKRMRYCADTENHAHVSKFFQAAVALGQRTCDLILVNFPTFENNGHRQSNSERQYIQ